MAENRRLIMKHDYNDIDMGFMFVSSGPEFTNSAILDRETGKIYYTSESGDSDELPEDIEDNEKYIEIPHKNDLDLGKRLVFNFVTKIIPEEFEIIKSFFSHPGAYSNYKNYLTRINKLKEWHKFEELETQNALKQWCKENNIEIQEEIPNPP
jgi:hypothetical protein